MYVLGDVSPDHRQNFVSGSHGISCGDIFLPEVWLLLVNKSDSIMARSADHALSTPPTRICGNQFGRQYSTSESWPRRFIISTAFSPD